MEKKSQVHAQTTKHTNTPRTFTEFGTLSYKVNVFLVILTSPLCLEGRERVTNIHNATVRRGLNKGRGNGYFFYVCCLDRLGGKIPFVFDCG